MLGSNAVPIVLNIGDEDDFKGIVDLVKNRAIVWHDETQGATFDVIEIPEELKEEAKKYRALLIEEVAVNKETKVEEVKIEETKPSQEQKPAEVSLVEPKSDKRVFISPLAKKLAEEKNININTVSGSGENGRIIKIDIENYQVGSPTSVVLDLTESFEEVNHSQMRKVIAKRLGESKFSAPHYYLSVEFDMTNAISFRNQFNSIPDTKVSFNDIIVKAASMALIDSPKVNSQWFEDRIRYNKHVHIGVAAVSYTHLTLPTICSV